MTCDLSPKLTGIAIAIQARLAELLTAAREFAGVSSNRAAAMVAKVFMGGEFEDIAPNSTRDFEKVEVTHTGATRPGSSELYIVAKGFRRMASAAPARVT